MITSAMSHESDESPNPDFPEIERQRNEDNLQWMRRLLQDYVPKGMVMLMLGGTDLLSFRLRLAQAHLRHDMSPSAWSHIALVVDPNVSDIGRSGLVEISLAPERGFGWAPQTNAVQEGVMLSRYQDAAAYPNIAVVDLPPAPAERSTSGTSKPPPDNASPRDKQRAEVRRVLERFKKSRGSVDCCELVVQWLAFAWGAGQIPNPLFAGRGIPSAVLVESLAAATGFDLTPGIDSRVSCPEAVWQGAKWWYGLHDQVARRRLMGAYAVSHRLTS